MKPSIKAFLLINLLLSFTLITVVATVGNLFLAHSDIQQQLDLQLAESGSHIKALLSADQLNPRTIKSIQQKINLNHPRKHDSGIPVVEFQVWDTLGHLILRTPDAPVLPLISTHAGIHTLHTDSETWRSKTLYDSDNNLTIVVAQRLAYRQLLESKLTRDSIYIILFTYPFLGVLIWSIVNRGLDSLRVMASELRSRALSNLTPVGLPIIPNEIAPILQELNQLFDRLDEAYARESRFISDAAHELKTPLAGLKTHAQIALKSHQGKDQEQALQQVITAAERSSHVVTQLLTLSRMAPEEIDKASTTIALGKHCQDICQTLAIEAINKNIDLQLLQPPYPIMVRANPTAIEIMMRNLIDNAIRYSDPHTHISVSLTCQDGYAVIKVVDSGPGIPEDLHERVFERFYRVIGNKAPGSGLGLGIVKKIVDVHHGHIQLSTPKEHRGLAITITLPCLNQKHAPRTI